MILMMFLLVGCHRNDELDKYEGTVMGNGGGVEASDLEEEDENSTVEAVFDEKEDVTQKQQKEQK